MIIIVFALGGSLLVGPHGAGGFAWSTSTNRMFLLGVFYPAHQF
jgi:hypothetical protein